MHDTLKAADVPAGEVRIRVDFLTAAGPIVEANEVLFGLSVVPGLDGLGMDASGGSTVYVLPYELHEAGLLTSNKPCAFMDLKTGVDRNAALRLLEARWTGAEPEDAELFRFRTESYVESAPGKAMALYRSTPPPRSKRPSETAK